MSTADQLVEQMFSWINKRERCAEQLKELAEDLESHRKIGNAVECVASPASVLGPAALIGAGIVTFFTGGAAAPLLGLAGACSGVGATLSVYAKIAEHLSSSDIMKEAQRIEKESNEIAEEIKKLFQRLKEEVKVFSSLTDSDEVERQVMTNILRAVARRNEVKLQINNRMFDDLQLFFVAGQRNMGLNLMRSELLSSFLEILNFFVPEFDENRLLLAVGLKLLTETLPSTGVEAGFKEASTQLPKKLSSVGVKTALKGGAMVVGGAVGLAFELPEAIKNWTDLIKNNHVTEASQSVRDTADGILKTCRTLRGQFKNTKKMLENLAHVKKCIENSNRSSEDEEEFIKIVTEMAEDELIKQWLRVNSRLRLFQLLEMFRFLLKELDKQKKKIDRDDIDIIFVAHGCIESMIPASCLLPSPTIKDVLLYSPWNCVITADVAYGVATGRIRPQHRVFFCAGGDCHIPDQQHQPENLPYHWNSMRNAGEWKIPNIYVSTLRKPEDGAWKAFEILQADHGQPGRNRIVIPFILPEETTVPFFVVTFVLSLVLFFTRFRATVHLAACLGKSSNQTNLPVDYLKFQYAYTIDGTGMTIPEEMLLNKDTDLYRAFKAVFG